MIQLSSFGTSTTPFATQAKLATLKLKTKSALSTGLSRSKRMLGTLHLPSLVWPR